MKLALALAGAVVLAGCATNEVSQQLASAPGCRLKEIRVGIPLSQVIRKS